MSRSSWEYFATVPTFVVLGSHEQNAVFTKYFITPSDDARWQQRLGLILLIGIVDASEATAQWVENVLADSDAKFVFLISHARPGRRKGVPLPWRANPAVLAKRGRRRKSAVTTITMNAPERIAA